MMGYYTYYTVSIAGIESEDEFADISKIMDILDDNYANEDLTRVEFYGSAKWYEWANDLRDISAKYPNIDIRVQGEGEEFPDLWVARFHNGKGCIADAIIDWPTIALEDLE